MTTKPGDVFTDELPHNAITVWIGPDDDDLFRAPYDGTLTYVNGQPVFTPAEGAMRNGEE